MTNQIILQVFVDMEGYDMNIIIQNYENYGPGIETNTIQTTLDALIVLFANIVPPS